MANAIGLKNVVVEHRNVIEEKNKYDFVVSRAVMNASDLVKLIRKTFRKNNVMRFLMVLFA